MQQIQITPMRNVTCAADCKGIFDDELTPEQRGVLKYIADRGSAEVFIASQDVLGPLLDSRIIKVAVILDEQFKEYMLDKISAT